MPDEKASKSIINENRSFFPSEKFRVKDDGVGIDRDASEKVFELFKRYKTSKGVEGAGLGLPIVKDIVERHGGNVWVESGCDKGVAFFFSISKNLA